MLLCSSVLICSTLSLGAAGNIAPKRMALPLPATPILLAQAKPENAPPPKKKATRRPKNQKHSFDFAKADIVEIVRMISKITGKNFIIPDKLKNSKLTILSPTQITTAEAYQVFLAALAANDLTLTRVGKFYRLIEMKSATKTPIPTCIGPEDKCPRYSDQLITELLRLQHIEPQQIVPVIKGLASKNAVITVFAPSNAVIVSEFARNLTRIKRMIKALDQPGFDDELQLMPIMHATAQEIADKLTQVFEVQANARAGGRPKPGSKGRGNKGGGDKESDVQISKIIADERTNQLIIKANRRSFETIRRLVEQLDVPVGGNGRVHVYYLENAQAEDLASTLSSLAQGQNQQGRRPPGRPNTKNSNTGKGDTAVLFEGDVRITADQPTNSLIIMASSSDYHALEMLIQKLDRARRQVFVEAAILEVNVNDSNKYGLDWHAPLRFKDGDLPGAGPALGFTQSAQGNGTNGVTSPTLTALTNPTGLLAAAGGSVLSVIGEGISIPVGDQEIVLPSFGVILRWLQSSSTTNVLSTPHLLTTDNVEASIEVGRRIPFQRGVSLPTSVSGLAGAAGGAAGLGRLGGLGGLNPFSSTDRIDVTLKLTLTPHVNEEGKVRLEIDLQIEDVAGRENGQFITSTRATKTEVVVDDQQTVVLGGLIRDKTIDAEEKIPLLGDLPLVGWLFKRTTHRVEKINLLLVLTPYIIHDSSDFQTIVERKMKEYEEFAATYYGHLQRYRATINYERKSGPLALLGKRVADELRKPQNGGNGAEETLITPEEDGTAQDAPKNSPHHVDPAQTDHMGDTDTPEHMSHTKTTDHTPDTVQGPVLNDEPAE